MKFEELRAAVSKLQSAIQDEISTAYAVKPSFDKSHNFISFYDQENGVMGYNITDDRYVEIKILQDLPPEALIEYADFVRKIELWAHGEVEEFPFTIHTGDSIEIRSQFQHTPDDADIDGKEAELS